METVIRGEHMAGIVAAIYRSVFAIRGLDPQSADLPKDIEQGFSLHSIANKVVPGYYRHSAEERRMHRDVLYLCLDDMSRFSVPLPGITYYEGHPCTTFRTIMNVHLRKQTYYHESNRYRDNIFVGISPELPNIGGGIETFHEYLIKNAVEKPGGESLVQWKAHVNIAERKVELPPRAFMRGWK